MRGRPWNRRYPNACFAISHFTHLGAILALRAAELAALSSPITWILGGLAYVFIAAMNLTSLDRTTQLIGPCRSFQHACPLMNCTS